MRVPASVNTVEFDRFGDSDVLHFVAAPMPVPGAGEVLVEVITAGINHIEGFIREGRLRSELPGEFPTRQGSDFAGIVKVVGPDAAPFKVGSEVIGHVECGAHATYLVASIDRLVMKPPRTTWEVAGSLFLAGYAALEIVDGLGLTAADTIVVSAAAGGVGSIEVQIARAIGATVIGTCGSRNFDYLRTLGIMPVTYGEGMVDRIRALAPQGVTAFVDNFGKDGHDIARDLGVAEARYRSSEDRKAIEVAALGVGERDTIAHRTRQLARLAAMVDEGRVRVLISGYYPMEQIVDAFTDLQRLHSRGKIILGTHPAGPYARLKARDIFDPPQG